jgi:hypothetical protein
MWGVQIRDLWQYDFGNPFNWNILSSRLSFSLSTPACTGLDKVAGDKVREVSL